MPLIDLKTNLKSLGYGNDRPDGGSSNQPYVVTPIPDEEALRTLAPDFLLRNGYLSAINSLDDADRIGKWFIDLKSPSGLLFTAKQQLLERQNPDIDDGINRFYNPLGTILQVGFLATGLHLNKQGVNPYEESYYLGGKTGYYPFTITQKSPDVLDEHFLNRLAASYLIKKTNQTSVPNFFYVNKNEPNILLSYPGGPGSNLGIGNTNIRIQNETGPVTDILFSQKFQPSYASELIYSKGYLTPNKKRPHVNYTYNPSITSGSSILALNAFKPFFDESFEGETKVDLFTFNISNILNRSEYVSDPNLYTSSLNPNIGAPKNDNGLAYRVDSRITEKRPFINWIYSPSASNGVSSTTFLDTNWIDGEAKLAASDTLFPIGFSLNKSEDNISNDGLNRKISYPSGRNAFIFDTSSADVKTYLTPFTKRPYINYVYSLIDDSQASGTSRTIRNIIENEEIKSEVWGNILSINSTINNTIVGTNEYLDKSENVGVFGRFEYSDDRSAGAYTYLVPLSVSGSSIPAIYKYGASTQYIGRNGELLNDNELLKLREGFQDENIVKDIEAKPINSDNNVYTFSYSQTLNNTSSAILKSTTLVGVQDFRKTLVDGSNGDITSLPNTDYKNFNREKTYQTSTTNYRGNYIADKGYQLDPNTAISEELKNATTDNDLIDFYFSTYNAANTSSIVIFKAYLEDWSDSYKGEWNGVKYMGRAEQLYKYNGFSRSGNITFNVPVLSKGDLDIAYTRLNQLINTVAPFYSTGNSSGVTGLMTGIVTRITMGDYWKSMPVLVNSINYTPISDMGWDIGRDKNGGRIQYSQLPKGIKVSLDFNIIHDYTPQYGSNFIVN